MLILLLITLVITLHVQSVYNSPPNVIKIIGGNEVNIKDFAYQVALIQLEQLWCGGSIISPNFVLTAAHCIYYATWPLSIHAGTSFWARPGSVHHVEYNVTYESTYEDTDVGLLRVIEPFTIGETRKPIGLFGSGEVVKAGTTAVVSGWGITDAGDISEQLMAVQVEIVDPSICNTSYTGGLSLYHLCAGNANKDSCQFDSGGPLVIEDRQVGIVSTGNGCGKVGYPGIYSNVGYFEKWIKEQIYK